MTRPVVILALAAALLTVPAPGRAEADPPAGDRRGDAELVKTAEGMFRDLRAATLENGLRVYLLPVKGSPVVTTMVAYRVGSADEDKDQTGLSHYLEHLMFKGTAALMPGDIDYARDLGTGCGRDGPARAERQPEHLVRGPPSQPTVLGDSDA